MLALVIVLPTLGAALAFIGISNIESYYSNYSNDTLTQLISILMVFPVVAVLWLFLCGCSEYWVSITILTSVVNLENRMQHKQKYAIYELSLDTMYSKPVG